MLPLAAAGIAAGIGALTGGIQALTSGKKAKEAALEAYADKAPKYAGNQAIESLYQQNLQEANTQAQNSALYKQLMNQANRNIATGIGASLAGGGGQGSIAKLVQGGTDAMGNALVQSEAQRERRKAALMQSTQLKAAEDWKKFQINQQQPWETKYNLLAAKAARAAEQKAAGLQNIIGAATSFASAAASGRNYGGDYGGSNSSTSYGKPPKGTVTTDYASYAPGTYPG